VLLPSAELKNLHKQVPILLSGKELPANCDIRYGQFYYFFMFNEVGELTDVADMSNGLTMRTQKGMSLPKAFLDMVAESMKITTSLASCERDYVASKGSQESFKKLTKKLDELERIGSLRVAAFLRENASLTANPMLTRQRALSVETAAVKRQVINKKAIDSLAGQIEKFLLANPSHRDAEQILENYLKIALRYSFDVPQRCRALAESWRQDANETNRAAVSRLAERLIVRGDQHVATVQSQLAKMKKKKSYDAVRLYAQIGDAEQTLKLLKETTSFPVIRPIHAAWRAKATAKLAGRR
jgi:hypothetical protein